MKIIVLTVNVVLLIAYTWQQYFRTRRLIKIGRNLAARAQPFSRLVRGGRPKILIAGDSTGLGVGASSPETSIAGLVGKKYSEAEIINVAISGAKIADVTTQLAGIDNNFFDLVMLHIGGNDVVRFTKYTDIEVSLQKVLQLAKQKGKYVLLTSTGNVGTVPLLPTVTRWIFERRTRRVRELCLAAVASFNSADIRFTDLFRERKLDPYASEPKKYYAADLFHPSDAGYQDWWQLISKELANFAKL